MTINATVSRPANAPKEVVWEILDEFPRISSWTAGIQNSYTTGDGTVTGLGAERRCELGGNKILDERIVEYREGESMTIEVWNIEGLPMRSTRATFSVHARSDGTSETRVVAAVEPKVPGVVQKVMGAAMSKAIAKNFGGLLEELATEAEARAAART